MLTCGKLDCHFVSLCTGDERPGPTYHRTSIATKKKLDLLGPKLEFRTGTVSVPFVFIGGIDTTDGDLSK